MRKSKNIIMVIILILSIGGMIFTMYHAKDNLKEEITKNEFGNMTPPDKPDNDSNMMEKQDGNTPPEKPSDSKKDSSNDTTSENEETSNNEKENITPPEIPSNETVQNNDTVTYKYDELTTGYYVSFIILSLITGLTLAYLIMSGFNYKDFYETFESIEKIIIYILGTIIITFVFVIINTTITKDYLLVNDDSNNINENSNINKDNKQDNSSITYTARKKITEDKEITSGKYSSSNESENAILVTGDITVEIKEVTVNKTGDSEGGDSTSFYGTNSAILAKDGANLVLKDIEVTTNATGANAIFSYGGSATTNNSTSDGTIVTISDSKITTSKDNSGGIMTTGGGITKATNLEITTSGTSSAAIRTDRGGGEVTVDGGTYTTTGKGSPAIYSTADIEVSNASLVAKSSEGIVIEGANSVTLNKCNLTDTNDELNGKSTTYKNIFLYQSMSGDADTGNSIFTATNSDITTNKGDTLYVTNTTATINLENNKITNNDKDGNFLRVQKDSWGKTDENGGIVTLNLTNQKVNGDIVIDSISTLDMSISSKSSYEGTINGDDTAKLVTLKIDKNSTIKLTGDSYVTSFEDADSSYKNIDLNGYKLYVNGKALKQK